MFRKHQITELEKTEILYDYLNDELVLWCKNVDPNVQTTVHERIMYLHEQIDFQKKKLKHLRQNA